MQPEDLELEMIVKLSRHYLSSAVVALAPLTLIGLLCLPIGCASSGDRNYRATEALEEPGGGAVASNGAIDNGAENTDGNTNTPNGREPRYRELTDGVLNQVRAYLQDLESADQRIKNRAHDELVDMGPVILPALEQFRTVDNTLAITAVTNDIHTEFGDGSAGSADNAAEAGNANTGNSAEASNNGNGSGNGSGNNGAGDNTNPATGGNTANAGNASNATGPAPASVRAESLFSAPLENPAVDEQVIGTYLWDKIREMEALAAARDYDQARALAQAILVLEPKFVYRRELQRRIAAFDEEILKRSRVRGRVTPLVTEAAFGESLTFKIGIKNVSDSAIKLVLSREEPRARMQSDVFRSPCVVTIRFTRWDDPRSPITVTSQEILQVEGEVTLGPGEVWSTEWSIYTVREGDEVESLGEYEVKASIRPIDVEQAGESLPLRAIECEAGRARVYPAYYRVVRDDPVGHVRMALAQKPLKAVYLLCACSAAEALADRAQAVRMLLGALTNATPADRLAVCVGLRAVTGYDMGYDERRWRDWYDANKAHPTLNLRDLGATDGDGPAPLDDLDLSDFDDEFDPTPRREDR